jgi:hypothetical protein
MDAAHEQSLCMMTSCQKMRPKARVLSRITDR